MPWTQRKYPDSLKNLNEPVRNKAIEIANRLLEKYSESRALAIATTQAKRWAAVRDIAIHAGAANDRPNPSKIEEIHVVPFGEGWGVRIGAATRPIATCDTQADAILEARANARSANIDVVIHGPDGTICDRVSLRRLEAGPNYHVCKRDDDWIVSEDGSDQVSRVFAYKADAIGAARELADRQHGTLFIHGSDGTVQRVHDYAAKS